MIGYKGVEGRLWPDALERERVVYYLGRRWVSVKWQGHNARMTAIHNPSRPFNRFLPTVNEIDIFPKRMSFQEFL